MRCVALWFRRFSFRTKSFIAIKYLPLYRNFWAFCFVRCSSLNSLWHVFNLICHFEAFSRGHLTITSAGIHLKKKFRKKNTFSKNFLYCRETYRSTWKITLSIAVFKMCESINVIFEDESNWAKKWNRHQLWRLPDCYDWLIEVSLDFRCLWPHHRVDSILCCNTVM